MDRKSLKTIVGKKADWHELAKDCVCFANAHPDSKIGDINMRIGEEIPRNRVRYRISQLTGRGEIVANGNKGGRTYRLAREGDGSF